MQGLARLQIVRREPERQFELFGRRYTCARGRRSRRPGELREGQGRILGPGARRAARADARTQGHRRFRRQLSAASFLSPWRDDAAASIGSGAMARVRRLRARRQLLVDDRGDDQGALPGLQVLARRALRGRRSGPSRRQRRPSRSHAAGLIDVESEPIRQEGDRGGDVLLVREPSGAVRHRRVPGRAALAGRDLPGRAWFCAEGPDAVRPGDLTGRQHAEAARSRLLGWLDDRLRFGFSEWNAPGYYEEDFAALFNLVDFALDDQARTRAAMAIDLMLFDMARLSHRGSFGVTGGRSHFKHKNCGYQQSTGYFAEVVFATRGAIVDAASGSAGSFASSPWDDVPEVLIRIAVDTPAVIVDRRRVSVDPREAALYGIGTTTEEDVLFWWSRGAFLIKEIVEASDRVVLEVGTCTPPTRSAPPFRFSWRLPQTGIVGDADHVADSLSVLTEGSALTGARLHLSDPPRDAVERAALPPAAAEFPDAVLSGDARHGCDGVRDPSACAIGELRDVTAAAATAAPQPARGRRQVGSLFGPIGGRGRAGRSGRGGHRRRRRDARGPHRPRRRGDRDFPSSDDGPDWWTGTGAPPRGAGGRRRNHRSTRRAIQWWLFESKTHASFPSPRSTPGRSSSVRRPTATRTMAAGCSAGWVTAMWDCTRRGSRSGRPTATGRIGSWWRKGMATSSSCRSATAISSAATGRVVNFVRRGQDSHQRSRRRRESSAATTCRTAGGWSCTTTGTRCVTGDRASAAAFRDSRRRTSTAAASEAGLSLYHRLFDRSPAPSRLPVNQEGGPRAR